MNDRYEQYKVQSLPDSSQDQYEKYRVKPEMTNTFLGSLPTQPIKSPIGSQEAFINPSTIENIITAGNPEMDVVKTAPILIKDLTRTTVGTGDPVIKAAREKLISALPDKQKEIEEAKNTYESNLQAEEQAQLAKKEVQAQAQREGVPINPNIITANINKTKNDILLHNNNLDDLSKQLEEQKNLPELPKITNDHIENVKNAENAVNESLSNVENAQKIHNSAQDELKDIESSIGHHLNEGADYPVRTSREFMHEINSIDRFHKNNYRQLMADLKDSKFQLNNPERLPLINNAVNEAKAIYGDDATGEFAQLMKKAPTVADTTASDFMAKQKDFRDQRSNLLQRMKSEPSAVKRDELIKAYRNSENIENIINDTLEEGLGQHAQRYREINNGYRELFQLRENPVAQKAINGQPLSQNMVSELSGYAPGQELMREIAKRNPEIKRNIVGQQLKNPENVYNPNEALREYTNEMPELNQLTSTRERAKSLVENNKNNLENVKSRHNEILNKQKETIKQAKEKETENKNIQKEKSLREKEYNDIQKKIDEHTKNIKDKEDKIKKLEDKEKELRAEDKKVENAEKNRKISLKDKLKKEQEYSNMKKQIKDLKQDVNKSRGIINKLASYTFKKGKQIFINWTVGNIKKGLK